MCNLRSVTSNQEAIGALMPVMLAADAALAFRATDCVQVWSTPSSLATKCSSSFKQDKIAAKQGWPLQQHLPRGTKLRITDVKQLFLQMKYHA
jgi:hypothetical protein